MGQHLPPSPPHPPPSDFLQPTGGPRFATPPRALPHSGTERPRGRTRPRPHSGTQPHGRTHSGTHSHGPGPARPPPAAAAPPRSRHPHAPPGPPHDPPGHPGAPPPCDPALAPIKGGSWELVGGGEALRYHCPPGTAPAPSGLRRCTPGKGWEPLPGGVTPHCRAVWCPAPLEFDHGWFWPRGGRHRPGSRLEFGCFEGFVLRGPRNRTCGPGGRWGGSMPVCDDGAGACPAPAVPPGATKEGSGSEVEARVRYRCRPGLTLIGSAERRCLEGGVWSGTEPRCRDPSSFDAPEDVAASFLASLTETVEASEANDSFSTTEKRSIRLGPGAALNIFLVLDASHSIEPRRFQEAREALQQLVEKIASYGASPRYGVVTFGTDAIVELNPTDPRATDGAQVVEILGGLTHRAHAQRPGTNLHAALRAVYELLVQQERSEEMQGLRPPPVTNSTRHVIVITTDGRANMGGSPVPVLHQIRELLSIGRDPRNDREDFLDVYVFGVGELVHPEMLNALASHKDGEEHVWLLRDPSELQETFHKMIDESSTLSLCGLAHEYLRAGDRERNPWHLSISVTRPGAGAERCQGALLSPRFVLTAAHCFQLGDEPHRVAVRAGKHEVRALRLLLHPQYDLGGRRARGVPEFYDYDVALVELQKPLGPEPTVRPICLPCTEGTSRALRLPPGKSSCEEHRRLLLPPKEVPAFFVTQQRGGGLQRQDVHLHLGEQRAPCERDALRAPPYKEVSALADVVTPRFLCSGGAQPQVDPNACRGDSGGPVVVTWGKRYFQVGVISWGVVDVCRLRPDPTPSHARDFHVSLFEVLPWLRQHLKDEDLGFLP